SDVPLRYQHEVHRRLRIDILETEDLRILVDLPRGNLAFRNPAEDAIVHGVGVSQHRRAAAAKAHRRYAAPSVAGRLFLQSRDALAPLHFAEHALGPAALPPQPHDDAKPEV